MSLKLLLIILLISGIAILVVLFRALILFPMNCSLNGWKKGIYQYKLSLTIFIILAIYETGNLTGFSWKRFEYVSDSEIINSAIRNVYPGIYSTASDLKVDYSSFTPEIRYWGSWSWEIDNSLFDKLLGYTFYQVRLPEEIAMVDVNGTFKFTRGNTSCASENGCPLVAPTYPEQGIVGTVQYGPPNYETAENFSVNWEHENDGKIFKSGHCFSAYIDSPTNQTLTITPSKAEPTTIRKGYGFYLVAINNDGYGSIRISKAEFLKSQSCSKEARDAWPSMGGSWKR